MTILFATVVALALAWAAVALVLRGGHLCRALTWAPLWGVLIGFWAAAPQIVSAQGVPGGGAAGWIGAYLRLVAGFAALGLVCAVPAGALLAAMQRVPPFRGRDAEWMFALGMVAALPLACTLLEIFLAACTGRPPVVLERVVFGGRHQVLMELGALGIALVVYRRATRRGWTTVVLAVPLILFSAAGAAALPFRVDRLPNGGDQPGASSAPQFADVADEVLFSRSTT